MPNFMGRVSRLEGRSGQSNTTTLSDDEVLEALRLGTYETRHIDALFQVIEPALLGSLVYSAYRIRPCLEGLHGEWQHPCSTINGAYWVMASGNGVESIVDEDLADWEEWFDKPAEERAIKRVRRDRVADAQDGLVRRLFRKHGLGNLRLVVKALCDASTEKRQILFDRFLPRADEAQRLRMGRISAPIRPFIRWPSDTFPLLVLSPDAAEFLYLLDNTGQEWTSAPRQGA